MSPLVALLLGVQVWRERPLRPQVCSRLALTKQTSFDWVVHSLRRGWGRQSSI